MLNDRVLRHLQEVADAPDLTCTRYHLQGRITAGGMGTVYLVRDTLLDRKAALKITSNPDEAQTLAQLERPGIVPVHDVGSLDDGRTFCVMKLVEGQTLGQFLSTTPSLNEALRVFLSVCDAAAFAHSKGIVHRDLTPPNIMVGSFGEVTLLDLGAAASIPRPEARRRAHTDLRTPTARRHHERENGHFHVREAARISNNGDRPKTTQSHCVEGF